jgi:predicted AlkP superfamily phosphohydrolase/phosphomutase
MQEVATEAQAIRYVEELASLVKLRTDLALYLLEQYDWDLGMIHYQETDFIQHVLWDRIMQVANRQGLTEPIHYAISRFFQILDDSIGRLLSACGQGTNTMIISDHGFQSHKGTVYPNVLFYNAGWLTTQNSKFTRLKQKLATSRRTRHLYTTLRKARSYIQFRHTMTQSESLQRDMLWDKLVSSWQNARAAMVMGHQYGFVYVRDKQDVNRCMKLLRDTTHISPSEPLFERAMSFQQAYGRTINEAYCHFVICVPREGFTVSRKLGPEVYHPRKAGAHPGTHDLQGVFIAIGSAFLKNLSHSMRLIDIAPTCLHLLGLPIPSDMDGQVALPILRNGGKPEIEECSAGEQAALSEERYGEEDVKLVEERLRNLGYLN